MTINLICLWLHSLALTYYKQELGIIKAQKQQKNSINSYHNTTHYKQELGINKAQKQQKNIP